MAASSSALTRMVSPGMVGSGMPAARSSGVAMLRACCTSIASFMAICRCCCVPGDERNVMPARSAAASRTAACPAMVVGVRAASDNVVDVATGGADGGSAGSAGAVLCSTGPPLTVLAARAARSLSTAATAKMSPVAGGAVVVVVVVVGGGVGGVVVRRSRWSGVVDGARVISAIGPGERRRSRWSVMRRRAIDTNAIRQRAFHRASTRLRQPETPCRCSSSPI